MVKLHAPTKQLFAWKQRPRRSKATPRAVCPPPAVQRPAWSNTTRHSARARAWWVMDVHAQLEYIAESMMGRCVMRAASMIWVVRACVRVCVQAGGWAGGRATNTFNHTKVATQRASPYAYACAHHKRTLFDSSTLRRVHKYRRRGFQRHRCTISRATKIGSRALIAEIARAMRRKL